MTILALFPSYLSNCFQADVPAPVAGQEHIIEIYFLDDLSAPQEPDAAEAPVFRRPAPHGERIYDCTHRADLIRSRQFDFTHYEYLNGPEMSQRNIQFVAFEVA